MFGNLSDYKKSLFLNIGVTLGAITVFAAFFVLLRMNISHRVSVVTDIRSKRASVAQSADDLASLVKDAPVARAYTSKLTSLVPTHDYLISSFSNDIKAIAQKDNVSLSFLFRTESPASAGQLGSIAFSATIDGSMNSILGFISEIESTYYAIQINTIDINKISDNASRMSASGQIFFESK
jgi:hypothetical protein